VSSWIAGINKTGEVRLGRLKIMIP